MKVNVKRPPSSVVKVFLRLVAVFVSVTTAPGTALPPASSAAPLSVAGAACALTIAPNARSGVSAKRLSRRRYDFCTLGLLWKIPGYASLGSVPGLFNRYSIETKHAGSDAYPGVDFHWFSRVARCDTNDSSGDVRQTSVCHWKY